jgi:hypothetical protein
MSRSAISAINAMQQATMSQAVVKTSGAGKAYQSVAQSMAIAVQDAADHMRNLQAISSTAVGVATAMMIAEETTDPWKDIIKEAQKIVATGAENFATIGKDAAKILEEFPSG